MWEVYNKHFEKTCVLGTLPRWTTRAYNYNIIKQCQDLEDLQDFSKYYMS